VDSLLYQTLLGAWPLDRVDDSFTERIKEYMLKAVREAKEQTSWRKPDEDYEQAVAAYVEFLMQQFGREGIAEEVAAFARRLASHGAINSLAQLLLKITAPGIPDIYQGAELWSFALVDPDNRRPVDYAARRQLLDANARLVDAPAPDAVRRLFAEWEDGRIKLLLTTLGLQCRSEHPDLFERGDVVPLHTDGPRSEHVFGFARSLGSDSCIVVLPRFTARLAQETADDDGSPWQGMRLRLPAALQAPRVNVLTGERLDAAPELDVERVFATVPFALLR
jgi:(1->4)-alpha-D-glucan 1-alpha-D-glucosylmutase